MNALFIVPCERRPSVLLRVVGLTSSRGLHICPGTRLGDSPTLCAEGTNILIYVATFVRTKQLHATPTIIFSWNPYPQSCDARGDSIKFPGIKILDWRKNISNINIPGWDCNNIDVISAVMALLR